MKTLSLVTLAGLSFVLAGVVDAQAFSRQSSWSGPRGTGSASVGGGCSNGTCSRSAVRTGAYGRSVSHSGSVTHTGPGQYGYSRSTTGPNGNTRTRSGSVVVTNGQ